MRKFARPMINNVGMMRSSMLFGNQITISAEPAHKTMKSQNSLRVIFSLIYSKTLKTNGGCQSEACTPPGMFYLSLSSRWTLLGRTRGKPVHELFSMHIKCPDITSLKGFGIRFLKLLEEFFCRAAKGRWKILVIELQKLRKREVLFTSNLINIGRSHCSQ